MEPMLRTLTTRTVLAAALSLLIMAVLPGCTQNANPAAGTSPASREVPAQRPELTSSLFDAISNDDEAAAIGLIEQGAPIDAVSDPRGVTVLHRAAQMSMPNLTRLLLEYGADVNARIDGEHHQPIHWAARGGASPRPNRPANAAEETVDVLLEYGADINSTTVHGVRPIDYAIQLEAHDWLEFLRSRGAE